MKTFSIVATANSAEDSLEVFFRSLARQTLGIDHIEVLLVDGGFTDGARKIIDKWQHRYPRSISCVQSTADNVADARNAGLAAASSEWVTLAGPPVPLHRDYFERIECFLRRGSDPDVVLICAEAPPFGDSTGTEGVAPEAEPRVIPIGQLNVAAPSATACFFRRKLLLRASVRPDGRVWSGLEDTMLTANYLLANCDRAMASVPIEYPTSGTLPTTSVPDDTLWKDKSTYAAALDHTYLSPLVAAKRKLGAVPRWLQWTVLRDLQWYFITDLRERAPTVIVNEGMAVQFHEFLQRIMGHIDVESIASLEAPAASPEIRHALLAYKGPKCHSPIALDGYDNEQGLFRLTYYVHGHRPKEVVLLDDERVEPTFSKYRACKFFRRTLLNERILWLPIGSASKIAVLLDGVPEEVTVGPRALLSPGDSAPTNGSGLLQQARLLKPPCKGGQQPLPVGWTGLKVRLVRWLARHWLVRRKFARAWVFVDRQDDADDNAEHMYRWVRRNHPEINAWFVLTRSSWDWKRLSREGFRLITPSWLSKLLILNSEQIISSHTDYRDGKFSRGLYGDMMTFRFAFLQHGVIKDDLSHWLSNQPFDLFITTSPAEHASIVDDDTPYIYTNREMRRTGLPRHDRLLTMAEVTPTSEVDLLLVMPTWRGSLVDQRALKRGAQDPMTTFANSEYARRWRTFLRDDELRELTLRHRKTIVFMPHPNAIPFIDAFDPPSYVKVATPQTTVIQGVFVRTDAFITDYTSVAFTMAFLRRIVFYYQFDRETYYGGDHNWREGYFDYERDGFGPVAFSEGQLMGQIRQYFGQRTKLDPVYLARMERAIPDRDSKSCERVFQTLLDVRQPLAGGRRT
jgi:CDP-glycerol glycerophosphotransferase (TagB/SpsB family)